MRKPVFGVAFLLLFGSTSAFSQSAVISVSPPSFSFSAVQSGPLPSSQTLQISNSGSGTLNWSISSNVDWLAATPASGSVASGSSPSNLIVAIIRTNLPPNTYTGKLTILGNATNSPQAVTVTYTVTAPITATISFSPPSFSFSAVQSGPLPSSQTLQISNSGSGTLNWSISSNVDWLAATPASGSVASGSPPNNLTVAIIRTNLPPNTYTGKLTILGNATNSPQEVTVTYTVASPITAVISLSPNTFNFSAMQGGPPPPVQTLQIRNAGTGSMTWTLSDDIPNWLSVSPPGPAGPTDVQLTAMPGSLVPGFYSHTLQVFSSEATNSPQAVVVNFEVSSPPVPVLQVSDDILAFEAMEGQADPPAQLLTIFNGGGGDLNWNLTSDQSWLFPANASGTNTGNVNVSVSIAGLSAGPHTGHLTVTAPGAAGSPRSVTVNLNIAPVLSPASLQVSHSSLDFNAQRNQAVPPQFIDINNGGQLPLNWTATILHGAAWLSINPPSGTDDGTITVSVTTDLAPQTYVDTIKIEAPGALNAPRRIPVRLNIPTAVGDEPGNRPRSFTLFQNYPNPFNPTTKIDFALPRSGHATLEVFNVVGQRIRVLVDGELSAGPHSIVWDGREASGQMVGSGIYFYRLKSLNFSDIKRMVFLK